MKSTPFSKNSDTMISPESELEVRTSQKKPGSRLDSSYPKPELLDEKMTMATSCDTHEPHTMRVFLFSALNLHLQLRFLFTSNQRGGRFHRNICSHNRFRFWKNANTLEKNSRSTDSEVWSHLMSQIQNNKSQRSFELTW